MLPKLISKLYIPKEKIVLLLIRSQAFAHTHPFLQYSEFCKENFSRYRLIYKEKSYEVGLIYVGDCLREYIVTFYSTGSFVSLNKIEELETKTYGDEWGLIEKDYLSLFGL